MVGVLCAADVPARAQQYWLISDSYVAAENVLSLVDKLSDFDGNEDEIAVASVLTKLRHYGLEGAAASPALTKLLDERSVLYVGRGPYEVKRLRAYLLATLADIGPGIDAMPIIAGELAHGMDPLTMAAAARAAGSLGQLANPVVVYLLDTLDVGFHDAEVDLSDYNVQGALISPTTVRREAIRALARIKSPDDSVAKALRQILDAPADGFYGRIPNLKVEAANAFAALGESTRPSLVLEQTAAAERSMVTPWLPESQRSATTLAALSFNDHDKNSLTFGDLSGQPLALIFFYSSCHNANKCSLAVSRLAMLQEALRRAGIADFVRLAAITYDPDFDTSLRLRKFGENRGLELGPQAMMLRASQQALQQLIATLPVQVNYGAGQINAHRLQLFLLDKHGRYVRQYHSVSWSDPLVVADLQQLTNEQ